MLIHTKALRAAAILAGLTLVALVGWISGPGDARADAQASEIQAVITKQLEAFRADDADAAWAIAAPTIQTRFGTKERFIEMVTRQYPQIRKSEAAVFKSLRNVDGQLVQRVFITGGPGDYIDAYYSVAQIDGVWRITGVVMTRQKPEGA